MSVANEYGRPPVYGRPPNASLVQVIEKVLAGQTQADAMRETTNG